MTKKTRNSALATVIFCSGLSLTACSSYGTSSSYSSDFVKDAKQAMSLEPGGIDQSGFFSGRPPLVIPPSSALNYLPVPGAKRLLPAVRPSIKKAPVDAYILYNRAYDQSIQEDKELSTADLPLSTVARVKSKESTAELAMPSGLYRIPASTAPIGDKGLDEARKELLRQEDPNLKPSKKPWWPSSKD